LIANAPADTNNPAGFLANSGTAQIYSESSNGSQKAIGGSADNTGGSQPLGIRNPYLGINYCIATQGIFPSRN
jgi:microcystin-dependent protein